MALIPHIRRHHPTVEDPGLAWIPGGVFRMGSDAHYPEECPAHDVSVDGFWMSRHPVTNVEFARFVEVTGYLTVAERPGDQPPGSAVFRQPEGPVDMRDCAAWWTYLPGACWRHPEGPGSDLGGREDHPVVHVTYEDALAYARWVGLELPTEAQWERAARGGLEGAEYCWGDDPTPDGRIMANTWQGEFPWQNLALDGHERTSPVGAFPPNGYGLHDMTGNVWEWTSDWFFPRHPLTAVKACCVPHNPKGPPRELSFDPGSPESSRPCKVLKGGSFLCALNYCLRYRPAARFPQTPDTSTCHIGFRCVRPGPGAGKEVP
jgi:sulfatase modifying factor 1